MHGDGLEGMLHATAVALGHVEPGASPERALLIASTEVLAAIVDDRGVITPERMLAMAKIVTASRDLQKQVSARRKQVLTQALAERMGVSPEDHRVGRAVTMWSAIVAGAYTVHPAVWRQLGRFQPRLIRRTVVAAASLSGLRIA